MNEGDIQLAVYNYRNRIQPFPLVITNIYLWTWESDAIYITRDGYVHEFEIKISHSDFLADAHKTRKHQIMINGNGPSLFYYVCPPNIIDISEVPEHAGLCYVIEKGRYYQGEPDKVLSLEIIKRAPRRKSKTISVLDGSRWREIAGKANARYWSLKRHYNQYKKGGSQ